MTATETRRRRFTPVEIVAAVTVAVLLVIVLVYSLHGLGRDPDHPAACGREADVIDVALERYRDRYGAGTQPSIDDLLQAGYLVDPPAFHTLTYPGAPPVPTLEPIEGGDCAVRQLGSGP